MWDHHPRALFCQKDPDGKDSMTGKQQSWESTLWPWIPIFVLLSKLPKQSHEQKARICVSWKRKSVWYHDPYLHLFPWERKLLRLAHARHFICFTRKPKKKKKKKQRFWSGTISSLQKRKQRLQVTVCGSWDPPRCHAALELPGPDQHLKFTDISSPQAGKRSWQPSCCQVQQVQCQALILLNNSI